MTSVDSRLHTGDLVTLTDGTDAGQPVAERSAFARERPADSTCPPSARVIDGPPPRSAGGQVRKSALRDGEGWVAVPR